MKKISLVIVIQVAIVISVLIFFCYYPDKDFLGIKGLMNNVI